MDKWNWSGEQLLRRLIALDYETTEHLNENNEGTPEQWSPVFEANTDCWRLLALRPKELVGYWSFFALKKEFFDQMKSGFTTDSQITIDRVETLDKPGVYNIYIVIICIKENYRVGGLPLLYESFIEKLNELTLSGRIINEVCVNAFSEEGERMCKHFGLRKTIPHFQFGIMYEGTYLDMCRSKLAREKLKLPPSYYNNNFFDKKLSIVI